MSFNPSSFPDPSSGLLDLTEPLVPPVFPPDPTIPLTIKPTAPILPQINGHCYVVTEPSELPGGFRVVCVTESLEVARQHTTNEENVHGPVPLMKQVTSSFEPIKHHPFDPSFSHLPPS